MKMQIARLRAFPLNIPLKNPFTIATGRIDATTNVVIHVELEDGSSGWGEAAVLPPVTEHTQREILDAVNGVAGTFRGIDVGDWRRACSAVVDHLGPISTAVAGVQMALIDAAAVSRGLPLWRLFGAARSSVVTDITIPICDPELATALARKYGNAGFGVIKTKIGQNLQANIRRILSIRLAHPEAEFLLDANEGFTASDALRALSELEAHGVTPILFEQPVSRFDAAGMVLLTEESPVPIAADESCRSLEDAITIRDERMAHVINLKLAKLGLLDALNIIKIAEEASLGLMLGAMVESRIGCGFAAHLVAGSGAFDYVDLDTALLMREDPVVGGCWMDGPVIQLNDSLPGQGIITVNGIPS